MELEQTIEALSTGSFDQYTEVVDKTEHYVLYDFRLVEGKSRRARSCIGMKEDGTVTKAVFRFESPEVELDKAEIDSICDKIKEELYLTDILQYYCRPNTQKIHFKIDERLGDKITKTDVADILVRVNKKYEEYFKR